MMIPKSIINNRLGFYGLDGLEQPHLIIEPETPEVQRKQLELRLVKLVQEYQRKGLDMKYINIDLLNGVDARVTLNETPNIQEQVADATGTRTKPEEPKQNNWGSGRGGRPWRRLKAKIHLRDEWTCQCCGIVTKDLELDHIVNVARGGTDDESNLQSLCVPCHKKKTQQESRQ